MAKQLPFDTIKHSIWQPYNHKKHSKHLVKHTPCSLMYLFQKRYKFVQSPNHMSLYNDWPFSLSKVPSIKSYTSTPHHPHGTIHKTTTKQQSKFWNVLVIVVDVLEKMTFFGENSQHSNSTNPKCSHPFLTTLTHSTPANSDPDFSPPPQKKKTSRNWNNEKFRKKKTESSTMSSKPTRSGFPTKTSAANDFGPAPTWRLWRSSPCFVAAFVAPGGRHGKRSKCGVFFSLRSKTKRRETKKTWKKKGGGWMIVFFWLGVVWVCIPSRELTYPFPSRHVWVDDFPNFRFGWVLCFLLEGRSKKKRLVIRRVMVFCDLWNI